MMTSLRIYLKRIRDILLTAQFWAWKNIDAQSYGFFHCRRYLSLDTKYHLKQKLDCLNDKVIKKYKFNDESLEKLMNKYDVIVPHRALVWNNYNQYKNSKGHHIRDLDFCLDVIKMITQKFIHLHKNIWNLNLNISAICSLWKRIYLIVTALGFLIFFVLVWFHILIIPIKQSKINVSHNLPYLNFEIKK